MIEKHYENIIENENTREIKMEMIYIKKTPCLSRKNAVATMGHHTPAFPLAIITAWYSFVLQVYECVTPEK